GRMPLWARPRPRHKLIALIAALVLVAVATLTSGLLPTGSVVGSPTPTCGYKIAYLSSSDGFVTNPASSRYGVALAVEDYNARHPGCPVNLVVPRTDSLPSSAGAEQVASDPKILGVVSALYLSDTQIAQLILDRAGVPTINPVLTAPTHPRYGVFHRTV